MDKFSVRNDLKWAVSTIVALVAIVFSTFMSTQYAMGEYSAKFVSLEGFVRGHVSDTEVHVDRDSAILMERRLGSIEWTQKSIEKSIQQLVQDNEDQRRD